MSILLHDKISPLIDSQFPAFYKEEGPLFVAFLKTYYEWLEQTGNTLYHSRHMLDYKDIDLTLDEFLPHYQNKYLNGTQTTQLVAQRELIKHSHDLYQTKGTIQSMKLIFRMLFNEDVEVYYPGDDILRASDGEWIVPRYIELSMSDRSRTYIGKDIIGNLSGARAFVESIERKISKGHVVDIAYLSNIKPNPTSGSTFIYGEYVSADGVIAGAPQVVGSLTRVNVIAAGSGFEEGGVVDIVSDRTGQQGRARITSVGNRTGEVNYRLLDGGYGYTLNANVFGTSQKVYVSANVLSLTAFTSSNSFVTNFPEFSQVVQPLTNVSFSTANADFTTGALVYGTTNTTSNVISAGFVLLANQASGSGTLLISPHSVSKATIGSVTDANTSTGSFNVGEYVYQSNSSGNAAVGIVVLANTTTVVIDEKYGPFSNGVIIIGASSNCTANATAVDNYAFNNTNFSNTNITKLVIPVGGGVASKTGSFDISATANVIGSNSGAVGVFQITNSFKGGDKTWIYSVENGATADVTVTSSGFPGQFRIGSIANTETVYLGIDRLNANNSSNVQFLSVPLNSTVFGFAANTSANLSSVIGTALTKNAFTIGTIVTLTERNPGFDNTAKPFVVEIEQVIASYGKKSRIACGVANLVGQFANNETVTQTIPLPLANVAVSNVSGTFNFQAREVIKQVRADGHTTYGDLYTTAVTSNTGFVRIFVANTANTFDTSNTIVGLSSAVTATVTGVVSTTIDVQATGIVRNASNTQVDIQRTSFRDFARNITLYGSESGATANVITIQEDSTSPVLGNNANVDPEAGISDGRINTIEILDSGYLYEDGETVTLVADGNQITAQGVARVEAAGASEGYWRGDRGTLDSTKRIQDNEYYQEHSYEIQSGVDLVAYEAAVKNLTHVAGTKMFNKFTKHTVSNSTITKTASTYNRIHTLTLSSVTGTFDINEVVVSSANASARVISFDGSLNTLQVVDTSGSFVAADTITGANSSATGTIDSTNILFL